MANQISASFSAEDEKKAMDCIAQLKALFPFGIKLSKEERKRTVKLDDGRIPFVEKGLSFGQQQPLIVPPYTDLTELQKDVELVKSIRRVAAELMSVAEMVNDTRIVAGAEAYQTSLAIYQSAKGAAKQGVPGTQTIVDEMGKLFANQGSKTNPDEAKAQ